MKYHLSILLLSIIWACNPSKEASHAQMNLPNHIVLAAEVDVQQKGPQLLVNGIPFSGFLKEYDSNEKVTSLTGFVNGLKEGKSESHYNDGRLKEIRFYIKNRKHGNHQGWWPNGIKKYDITFDNGLTEGKSSEWYEDGTAFKVFHYEKGQEVGSQKMWELDGGIRANYVVKNGHRYGLIGLKNCKSVEDEYGSLTAIAY